MDPINVSIEDLWPAVFSVLAAFGIVLIVGMAMRVLIWVTIALRQLLPQRGIATLQPDLDGKARIVNIAEPPDRAYGCAKGEVSAALRSFAMSLGERPQEAWWSTAHSPLVGRLLFYGGGILQFLGPLIFIFLCLRLLLFSQGEWAILGPVIGLAAVAAFTFVGKALRSTGKKMQQPTARELRIRDQRKPIVLLRSFQDDDLNVVESKDRGEAVKSGFEVGIADEFAPFGPFVAIGRPGESLPALGAAREYYSDTEWKKAVVEWMDAAFLLVVIPGLTGGVGWELDLIREISSLFSCRLASKLTKSRNGATRESLGHSRSAMACSESKTSPVMRVTNSLCVGRHSAPPLLTLKRSVNFPSAHLRVSSGCISPGMGSRLS
jgi:hypothetical protein